MNISLLSKSVKDTIAVGAKLGKTLHRGDVVALYGELGAGKTHLAKGIAKGLSVKDLVRSPSFVIMNVYKGTVPVYHFDFYRLKDARQLENLAFFEYLNGDGVCVIEWADRVADSLPRGCIRVFMRAGKGDTRTIRISGVKKAVFR